MQKETTVIQDEIQQFDDVASEWWEEKGTALLLHRMNPLRLSYIHEQIAAHFKRPLHDLKGLHILDVGCGGGILTEPLSRLGAKVQGIDASSKAIAVAREHAEKMKLEITYNQKTAEDLAEQAQGQFDVVTMLELIEHVQNPALLIEAGARLLKPSGILFVATINRSLLSLLGAKIAAEYIFRFVPKGTHSFEHFLRPSEIVHLLKESGMELVNLEGLSYRPWQQTWKRTSSLRMNYILTAKKVI